MGLQFDMRWSIQIDETEVPIVSDDDAKDTVVILAHGAGSHMDQKTVLWLAELLGAAGARVVRFNFLYRAAGRSMPDRMPILMQTYREVIESVRERLAPARLIIAGHSMGGRTASMIEGEGSAADGLILFGYPLHPAGQPDKLRDAHLAAIKTPTLQLNGTEDLLCTKEIMDRIAPNLDSAYTLQWIEGADHSYAVKKSSGRTRQDVEAQITAALTQFIKGVPGR